MVVKVYTYEELRETFNIVRDVCGPDVSARFADHYYGTEQRLGQAFSNALAESPDVRGEDYARLSGIKDPFFHDTTACVRAALEDLTRAR